MSSSSELAELIATEPGAPGRLLAVHVSDGAGRCRGCTTPGTGTPLAPWPCSIHFYASAAAELVGRRRPGGPALA
ncbi:MAG: hypothetical protein LH603_19965 [Pseudonocardia sp.]|nr:hypothetical protein [Pseudonocardia sp.]